MIKTPTPLPSSPVALSWHLLLGGVQLEQIRGDRVLQEALAAGADPLHLTAVFHLSLATATATATAYVDVDVDVDVARSLLVRLVEAPPSSGPSAPPAN